MDVFKARRQGMGRKRMKRRKDRRVFSKSASKVRRENVSSRPMRGGIRL